MAPVLAAAPDAAWVHDLSPWVFRFSGEFGIRWYGLAYVAGFIIAYVLFRWLAKRGATFVPADRVLDAIMWGVFGVVIGGRLGYFLVYDQSLLGFTDSFPFWKVFALNQGGMASHGGIVGVILAAWRISRGFKDEQGAVVGRCSPMHVMDVVAMLCPFGLFLGRIANFINAELLGAIVAKPGEPGPWWSVRYPQEIMQFSPEQLAQTDAQWGQLQDLAYAQLTPAERGQVIDAESAHSMINLGYERLISAVQHDDGAITAQMEQLISARAPSQLLQALAEGVILAAVLWFIAHRPRLPGVVGCWFMITYGVLRIATELVRLPDAELGRTLGLSRGQWLSTLMVLVGVGILVWIVRRGGTKVGGWLRPAQPVEASSPVPAPSD
ncbi:MAG: prolipoprotein diacylglyceryl transferase [Phycisphaeraceae bacterium]|nr:MAG: prolipoprotein diacylglyceryl transferase [Phycisphaeraceae bacterium]